MSPGFGCRTLLLIALISTSSCSDVMTQPQNVLTHDDSHTEDLTEVPEDIYDVRYDNEDRPRHCRVDLCTSETYNDSAKGTFFWPDTQLVTRVHVRCPYSVLTPVYAYRDCVYAPDAYNVTVRPGLNNSLSEWADPMVEHCPDPPLEELLTELMKEEKKVYDLLPPPSWYADAIDRIHQTMTSYREYPVRPRDVLETSWFVTRAVQAAYRARTAYGRATVRRAVGVVNELFTIDRSWEVIGQRNTSDNERFLESLVGLSEMWTLEPGEVTATVADSYITVQSVPASTGAGNLTLTYSATGPLPLQTSVTLELPETGSTDAIVHVLYLGYPDWLDGATVVTSEGPFPRYAGNVLTSVVSVSVSSGRFPNQAPAPDGRLTFTAQISKNKEPLTPSQCAGRRSNLTTDSSHETVDWLTGGCLTDVTSSHATCRCASLGLHSVFADKVGFPYVYELYVAGEVLRAVSMVCLVLTIISHVMFRKSFLKSVPSQILVHLCVALILFNIVLYVANYVGHSRWGCRIMNILRYYLVMVSLGWNVTEAINLYRMLVRVFQSRISHFVLKATVMAWGIPLIPIVIVLSVSERGFDGKYFDNCTRKCVLKDLVFYYAYLLPLGMIMVSNIVIFGFVIKVIRNHSTSLPKETTQSSALSQLCGAVSMMFLLGIPWVFSAFGALNIRDGGESRGLSMVAGVFQVIAIVFLNLQGAFLFVFHCVRNADIRDAWRSALRRLAPTSAFTSSTTSSPSDDRHRKLNKHIVSGSGPYGATTTSGSSPKTDSYRLTTATSESAEKVDISTSF